MAHSGKARESISITICLISESKYEKKIKLNARAADSRRMLASVTVKHREASASEIRYPFERKRDTMRGRIIGKMCYIRDALINFLLKGCAKALTLCARRQRPNLQGPPIAKTNYRHISKVWDLPGMKGNEYCFITEPCLLPANSVSHLLRKRLFAEGECLIKHQKVGNSIIHSWFCGRNKENHPLIYFKHFPLKQTINYRCCCTLS